MNGDTAEGRHADLPHRRESEKGKVRYIMEITAKHNLNDKLDQIAIINGRIQDGREFGIFIEEDIEEMIRVCNEILADIENEVNDAA